MVFAGLDQHREFDLSGEPAIGYFNIVEGAAIRACCPGGSSHALDDHISFVQVQGEILDGDTGDLDGGNDLIIDDIQVIQGLPLNELQEDQIMLIDRGKILKKHVKLSDFIVFLCLGR